ncbi:MAG: 16S rRNA (uracil(1498)-N(3))-methyltransferase [Candidatus Omnitrophica bacterium]|nr:16S rRNA (uracil(1498)-N(3))-methyltransferase [Candidatus Omnitrophota bacterium]
MSRFFVPKEAIRGKSIFISGKEAHHVLDVMRLKPLDKIVAFDGSGREYVGFIKDAKPGRVSVEIVETRTPSGPQRSRITLIQALPKKEKMDYIVEKSTELGVHSIMPVITERTIPKWDASKKTAQAQRWMKIAKEASKQCGRVDIPTVSRIMTFPEALVNGAADYDLRLIAALTDETIRLKEALSGFGGGKVVIAIGPEGDFTLREVNRAKEAGFKSINLGPRVLKSDTAGLAALAILNYELSNC